MGGGEIYEQLFIFKALEKGYTVNTPVNVSPYDLILDIGSRLLKVQVKSSAIAIENFYSVSIAKGCNGRAYDLCDFDYYAIYLIAHENWYLIPIETLSGLKKISINPDSIKSKYTPYKEAWELLFNPLPL